MKKRMLILLILMLALILPIGPAIVAVEPAANVLTDKEMLGKMLFFDKNLSLNENQSCATCHAPEVGFVGPDSMINAHGSVYEGSIPGAFGDRKPPTAAYGGESPILYLDAEEGLWIGGMFWDGRATGWTLGDPLAEQAQGPFLNPVEQAVPDSKTLCEKVASSDYAYLYNLAWGEPLDLSTTEGVRTAYDNIGRSIAAYERSAEVNPFSSKYDYYLKGQARLTGLEKKGLKLFEGKAMCSACHISEPGPNGEPPLFTDFTYDNLGIPKNPENPIYNKIPDFIDYGLGGFLKAAGYPADVYEPELGKFKVPTLRNVDLRVSKKDVKAFGHNGVFKSLYEIVHFYNTRDVLMWPAPEYGETVNTDELGDLGLTWLDEEALVAFLKTLNDGYRP
jgi:cytochrome c peroxidase